MKTRVAQIITACSFALSAGLLVGSGRTVTGLVMLGLAFFIVWVSADKP